MFFFHCEHVIVAFELHLAAHMPDLMLDANYHEK